MTTDVRGTVVVLAVAALSASNPSARQLPAHAASTAGETAVISASLRVRGQRLCFDLDYPSAQAVFREAMAADPSDPSAYRLAAATAWIELLFRRGAVMADDFLGQAKSSRRRPPVTEQDGRSLDAFFRDKISRALTLAEQRRRELGDTADAHFQLGATYGFQATYAATVEGSLLETLRAARRAYAEHQRVLDIDAGRKDAGLIVGMYRYGVSTLSLPSRLIARLAGFQGGREQGIRLVEEAAAYPSDAQFNAQFVLVAMYNREAKYDDALRVIGRLQGQFPRNRLLWLEAGSTAYRAGRLIEARRALEEGLSRLAADTRPRAFSEAARWRYYYGATLVALDERDAAARELRAALADPARDWLQGRIHVELGKLADLTGDHTRAASEYRLAARLCAEDNDDVCAREARALLGRKAPAVIPPRAVPKH